MSGLNGNPGKVVCQKWYREFESPSLRSFERSEKVRRKESALRHFRGRFEQRSDVLRARKTASWCPKKFERRRGFIRGRISEISEPNLILHYFCYNPEMKQKPQIFLIHGGMTFKNQKDYIKYLKTRMVTLTKRQRWQDDFLTKNLGKDFEIIQPRMPQQDNAKYEDWKIYFERFIPHLRNNVILIGSSLGGIFLAQYLSENKFPKKILSTYLICPPYDNSVIGEDLVGGFKLKSDLSLLPKNTKNLYLMFSKDDDSVPVSHAEKYRKKLPNTKIIIYPSKNGHFNISKFPEIVRMIKKDVSTK